MYILLAGLYIADRTLNLIPVWHLFLLTAFSRVIHWQTFNSGKKLCCFRVLTGRLLRPRKIFVLENARFQTFVSLLEGSQFYILHFPILRFPAVFPTSVWTRPVTEVTQVHNYVLVFARNLESSFMLPSNRITHTPPTCDRTFSDSERKWTRGFDYKMPRTTTIKMYLMGST